jgi:peptide/nickel transport system substrate-binding protein
MKTDRPPFDNVDVRRALMRMVDREELVKVALQGQATAANDVFGKGFEYYADDLPAHTHDPDEAKALLRRAGVGNLTVGAPA